MPIICVGFFDQDLHPESVMKWKWVYMSGRDHMDLNVRLMLQWFVQALIDSVLLFCICLFAYGGPRGVWAGSAAGSIADMYIFGTTVYSCMFVAMMYKVATCTYTWTRVNWFFFIGSMLLYLIFLFAYSALAESGGFFWVPEHMMSQAPHWLLVLLVPLVSVAIDYTYIYTRTVFYPSPVDMAVEKDRILRAEKRQMRRKKSLAARAAVAAAASPSPAAGSGNNLPGRVAPEEAVIELKKLETGKNGGNAGAGPIAMTIKDDQV